MKRKKDDGTVRDKEEEEGWGERGGKASKGYVA